jgi:tRNA A37 threonylcarbamoyladenosine biosynthesis protein TsaE
VRGGPHEGGLPGPDLARGYEGTVNGEPCPVNHLDLYRLEGLDMRDSLDLEEYLDPASVTFIEWAEPAISLLEDPTVVELSHETPATRRVRLWGPAAECLARDLRC